MVRLIAHVVAVRDFAAEILASLYIDFKYCFDLFAGGTAMPSLNKLMIGIMSSAVLLRSAVSTPSLIAIKRIWFIGKI